MGKVEGYRDNPYSMTLEDECVTTRHEYTPEFLYLVIYSTPVTEYATYSVT